MQPPSSEETGRLRDLLLNGTYVHTGRHRQPLPLRAVLPGRVHPRLPVGEVPDLPRLVRRARSVLEANKERVEQTTTGDVRKGRQTWVYRRDKQPCRRCGTTIRVETQGPETPERASYWCPSCQPDPR